MPSTVLLSLLQARISQPSQEHVAMSGSSSIVEIIGPAGAGKSTLTAALFDNSPILIPSQRLTLRTLSRLPSIVGNGMLLAPIILRRPPTSRWLTRTELKRMIYLRSMHRRLRQQSQDIGPVLIDQGPVFYLAHLLEFGPVWLREQRCQGWLSQTLRQWATTLSMVVWVDAPVETLLTRINGREKRHEAQELPSEASYQMLLRYRHALATVLDLLSDHAPIEVLKFQTDRQSTAEIASEVLRSITQKSKKATTHA